MARFPLAYRVLQIAGAAYLVWLGIKLLMAAWRSRTSDAIVPAPAAVVPGIAAARAGFLTNISNPKVVAYYASLFGVLITADAPAWLFWASVGMVAAVSAA
jgi:threonine efflux protein